MTPKVIEFKDKYPNYDRAFFAYNEPTDTEKLLDCKKASLVFDAKNKREYQEFYFKKKDFDVLLSIYEDGTKVHSFFVVGKTNTIHFRGVRRLNSIYAICLETHERVLLNCA